MRNDILPENAGDLSISTTIQYYAQSIYLNLHFPSIHVSGAEVLAQKLIGTCTRTTLTTTFNKKEVIAIEYA